MRTLAFILCLSVIAGCKKGKADVTLKGLISDSTFGTSLNNSIISLYSIAPGTIDQTLVDKINSTDGTYSFTFKRDKVEGYVLKVEKTNYFTLSKSISLDELTIEEDNIRNYSTTAKSWAAIRLINDSPLVSDAVTIIKQSGKNNCDECCTLDALTFYGAIDTVYYCINDGNTNYSYNYFVQGGGNGTISAVTTAFDTTELVLHY